MFFSVAPEKPASVFPEEVDGYATYRYVGHPPQPDESEWPGPGPGCLPSHQLSQEVLSVRNPAFLKASQKSGAKQ